MARTQRATKIATVVVAIGLMGGCTVAGTSQIDPQPTIAPREPATAVDPITKYAQQRLSTMTLKEKVLSMLMVHVPGTSPAATAGRQLEGVGGFILMGDNIPATLEQLAAETAALSPESGLPLLIATDQEGGIVRRVPTDTAKSAEELRFLPPQATFAAFSERGKLLDSAGISVNFGIVADVVADSSSFIYERSFGATGEQTADRVVQAVEGESAVLSTLKHFPGHGAASGDSHSSIPSTDLSLAEWSTSHAVPFAAGIEAGADLVMFGHLAFTAVDTQPATFSKEWHRILREEFAFDGIVITDDMGMLEDSGVREYSNATVNALRAIEAGNTMLLYVGPVDTTAIASAVATAIEAESLDEAVIDDAALKLLEVRRTLSGQTGRFVHCFADCAAIAG